MVIGNIFRLPWTFFSQGSTLATVIVNNFSESTPGLNRSAIFELALILFVITVVVNALARGLLWRFDPEAQSERPSLRHRLHLRAHVHRPLPRTPTADVGTSAPSAPLPPSLVRSEIPDWRRRALEQAPRRIVRRRAFQWVIVALAAGCVILAVAPFASLIVTAVQFGGSAVVHPSFYTSLPPQGCNPRPGANCSLGGIGPEIQGTLIMLGLGALIAVPVGILTGIYLSEYGRGRFGRVVSFLADVMTGVPTIILGVFVFALFLDFDHYSAESALSGGFALGVIMIPIAVRATEEALRAVPLAVRESALALGFPRHRVTLRVVLGSARRGLVTGLLLASSRAAGDTAVLLLCAGFSNFWFTNLNLPTASMTVFIFNNFGSSFLNLQTDAWGAALVMLAIMLTISLGTRLAVPAAEDAAEVG